MLLGHDPRPSLAASVWGFETSPLLLQAPGPVLVTAHVLAQELGGPRGGAVLTPVIAKGDGCFFQAGRRGEERVSCSTSSPQFGLGYPSPIITLRSLLLITLGARLITLIPAPAAVAGPGQCFRPPLHQEDSKPDLNLGLFLVFTCTKTSPGKDFS